MNKDEVKTEIEKLKQKFSDNEKFVKKGMIYHRFVIHKIDVPKELQGRFVGIMKDDKGIPHAVVTITEGISEEERERRKTETTARRAERAKIRDKFKKDIKRHKELIKNYIKAKDFIRCQDEQNALNETLEAYKAEFARKK